VDIAVYTVAGKMAIFASKADYPYAIPVIINRSKNRESIDVVSMDSTDWIVRSDISQKVIIRMYILSA